MPRFIDADATLPGFPALMGTPVFVEGNQIGIVSRIVLQAGTKQISHLRITAEDGGASINVRWISVYYDDELKRLISIKQK